MKIMNVALAVCLTSCVSLSMKAQVLTSSKPSLFTTSSATFQAGIPELQKAFFAKEGSDILLKFGNSFSFNGTVVSSVQRYSNLTTIIIKSTVLHNTLLSVSKRINDDNSVTYIGHILNENFADGYELKKTSDGNYLFEKIKTEELIQDR